MYFETLLELLEVVMSQIFIFPFLSSSSSNFQPKDVIFLTTASIFHFQKLVLRMKKKIMDRHAGKKMIIKQISNYKKNRNLFGLIATYNFFLLVVDCVPNHDQIPPHFLSLLWIMIILHLLTTLFSFILFFFYILFKF